MFFGKFQIKKSQIPNTAFRQFGALLLKRFCHRRSFGEFLEFAHLEFAFGVFWNLEFVPLEFGICPFGIWNLSLWNLEFELLEFVF